jgi:hypothetical protein
MAERLSLRFRARALTLRLVLRLALKGFPGAFDRTVALLK